MGQYLSSPNTEKESEEGGNEILGYGLAAMQGWRVSMEDAHIAELELDEANTALFSVFDGHGGKVVALFCANKLAEVLVSLESYKCGDLGLALAEAYYRMDEMLESEGGRLELEALVGSATESKGLFSDVEGKIDMGEVFPEDEDDPSSSKDAKPSGRGSPPKLLSRSDSSDEFRRSALQRHSVLLGTAGTASGAGPAHAAPSAVDERGGGDASEDEEEQVHRAAGMGCTAVSVVVRGEEVVVANTGDSRCVLSRRGEAHPLTLDHKPILYEEAQRIIRAGGFVRDNRINGALNVSRTIGDLDFKRNKELPHTEQMVVATPDITSVLLQQGDEFLILACDGIWDVLSNQEAVDFVRKRLKQGMPLRQVCEEVCDRCLAADLKGMCRGADNMSVCVVVFKRHASLESLWSRIVAMFKRKK